MTAALEAGADFVGLVFHPASPRYVEIEVAAYLAAYVPAHVSVVGLFVNPTEETLRETLANVRIDMIQLHGQETPEDCARISHRNQKPVMKALSVHGKEDLQKIVDYEACCDWLLLDAPGGGGTGMSFDWSMLDGIEFSKPWMMAGGLTPDNVGLAIKSTHPNAVDVSSGVEISRGEKDPGKILNFLTAVRTANEQL